jgi:uncharacterized membrane protein
MIMLEALPEAVLTLISFKINLSMITTPSTFIKGLISVYVVPVIPSTTVLPRNTMSALIEVSSVLINTLSYVTDTWDTVGNLPLATFATHNWSAGSFLDAPILES